MGIMASGTKLLAAMPVNRDLLLLSGTRLQFFMAIQAQSAHLFRTQQQISARHIGWMHFAFEMRNRSHFIFDRKRHGFFGWMVASRSGVANFATRAILHDHVLYRAALSRFAMYAGRPFF